MATFKNVSGGPLDIPALDLHLAVDATFTVDDLISDGFRGQPNWDEITTGITPETPAVIPGPVAFAVPPIAPATPTDAPAAVTEIGA